MFEFSRDLTAMKVIKGSEKESLTFVRSKVKVLIGALVVFIFMGCWIGAVLYTLYKELNTDIPSYLYIAALSVFALIGLAVVIFVVPKIKESYGEEIIIDKASDSVVHNQKFISNLSKVKDVWLDENVNYDSDNELNLYIRFFDGNTLLIDTGGDKERYNRLVVELESFLNRTAYRSNNV